MAKSDLNQSLLYETAGLHLLAVEFLRTFSGFKNRGLDSAEPDLANLLVQVEQLRQKLETISQLYSVKSEWDDSTQWFLFYLSIQIRNRISEISKNLLLLPHPESVHRVFVRLDRLKNIWNDTIALRIMEERFDNWDFENDLRELDEIRLELEQFGR